MANKIVVLAIFKDEAAADTAAETVTMKLSRKPTLPQVPTRPSGGRSRMRGVLHDGGRSDRQFTQPACDRG